MKKAMILIWGVSAAMIFSSCHAQQTKHRAVLTKQIVEQTIQRNYYPPIDTQWHKMKLDFHSIKFGKPETAGQLKIPHFPDTTVLYPVLIKYTSTWVNLREHPYPYKYQVDDITRDYVFYLNQWGDWAVRETNRSVDSDIKSHHD